MKLKTVNEFACKVMEKYSSNQQDKNISSNQQDKNMIAAHQLNNHYVNM